MSKISNQAAYPAITPVLTDYFVLTDAESNLATKTCTLESLQTLFGLGTTNVSVVVSSSALTSLGTTDVVLIASPGAGYILDIQNIIFFMQAGSVAYDFGAAATLVQGGHTYTNGVTQTVLNSPTDTTYKQEPAFYVSLMANTGLVLGAAASPTVGNGVLYANITYQTLKLDSTF